MSDEILNRLNHIEAEISKIKALLPSATTEMIFQLMKDLLISVTTVRIWAEQEALSVDDGRLVKITPNNDRKVKALFEALRTGDIDTVERLRF